MSKFLKIVNNIRLRIHALIVLLIVAWAGYSAIMYLVETVFNPATVPAHMQSSVMELDSKNLKPEALVNQEDELKRVPLAHYHGIDRWFMEDQVNGCITEGCHSIMPHRKKEGVRAFNNFHVSFLSCQMCHAYDSSSHNMVTWASLDDGHTLEVPALLKLKNILETSYDKINSAPEELHELVVPLLEKAVTISGDDPVLSHYLTAITTAVPASPVWKKAMQQLAREVPLHIRGEYGAKMVVLKSGEANFGYMTRNQEIKTLAKQFHAAKDNKDVRRNAFRSIHSRLVRPTQTCLSCHSNEKALFDFAQLGYSDKHAEYLSDLPIAVQIQEVQQGKQFYIKTHKGVGR